MSTIGFTPLNKIHKENKLFSSFRATIESAFYGNNVTPVKELGTAYLLAKNAPGTIVTDIPVKYPEKLALPADAKVLVTNNGGVVGRTAAARRIIGQPGIDAAYFSKILREAVYQASLKPYYSGEVVIGLAEDFMAKAHLMLPEQFAVNFYSYLLNFQIMNEEYKMQYTQSKAYDEGDIFVFADPDWSHPDFPQGLALFDPEHNVAAILGLRYFGELKKSSLTLAWATAHRNGYIACHGGMKQYDLGDSKYTMAAFGLSGSGKSTITLSRYGSNKGVTVLHDDAFVINKKTRSTTALEPAYFDKTQDYPMDNPAVDYFLTVQNTGITLDEKGRKVLVNEDVRNGNGRTVKSRFVTDNRVDHLAEKIDAVYWIMKDDTLPPVMRIDDPVLATIFGTTLATKRSTAENLAKNVDLDKLVIEPFANPFRVYSLTEDYQDFHDLFESGATSCYILNTGFFNGNKVTPHDTLSSIEAIVNGTATFANFGPISGMSYLELPQHPVSFDDADYMKRLRQRMQDRLNFIEAQTTNLEGFHALPQEATDVLKQVIKTLK